jgi:hypothetical protein
LELFAQGAKMKNLFMQTGNALTTAILRSPLHWVISKNSLLLALTGSRRGHTFTFPVNYFQGGDILYITSLRNRTWWRHLRGGAPVKVRFAGRDMYVRGNLVEDGTAVLENLKPFFQHRPEIARYFGIRLESQDQPNTGDISKLAEERVLVKVNLRQRI